MTLDSSLKDKEGDKSESKSKEVEVSSDDNAGSDASDDEQQKYPQTGLERKQMLLKMLEKQGGGAKQTFNFEEDDTIGHAGATAQQVAEGAAEARRKQRGRPPNPKMQIAEDDEEDMDDEEVEY